MTDYPFKLPTPPPTIVVKTRNGKEKVYHLDSTIITNRDSHKLEYVMTNPDKEHPDDIVSIKIYYKV